MVSEEMSFENVNRRTPDGRMMDDGQSAVTIARPEHKLRRSKKTKNFGCLPEDVGCFPLTVVIMTTAKGRYPTLDNI